jgi:hypothetical protein
MSCVLMGASTVTACGDVFTQATDGSPGGPDAASDGTNEPDAPEEGSTLEAGQVEAGVDAGVDAHHDASVPDAADAAMDAPLPPPPDAGPDATGVGDAEMDSAAVDSPPPPPPTDACTSILPDPTDAVFVANGGTTGTCGAPTAPCASIQAAVTLASQSGKHRVFVANGTYTETVTLATNVSILGGWTDMGGAIGWQRACGTGNAANVTLQAPAGSNKTIIANGVTGVTIDTLTVTSKAPNAVGTGESLYGIFATNGANIDLINVFVSTAGGGTGGSGGSGGTGTNASGTCATSSDGQPGGTGGGGAAGQVGTFDANGYRPAIAGTGGTGVTGDNGTLSGPGFCTAWVCGIDVDGRCDGTHTTNNLYGQVGAPGCGGTGATGGGGGSGGGSSIALYVWGSTVSVSGGALTSGNGGTGGPGGPGGTIVGSGSAGKTGPSGAHCGTNCVTQNPTSLNPTCVQTTFLPGGAGGVGGTGGTGGSGGAGGGGAGGSTYSYYSGGGSSTIMDIATQLHFGTAGGGGSGGNTGGQGAAGTHN